MTNRVLTRLKMGIFLHASFQLHNRPSSHLLLLYRLMHSANINTPTPKQERHRENEIFCSRFIFFCSFLASRLLSPSTHSLNSTARLLSTFFLILLVKKCSFLVMRNSLEVSKTTLVTAGEDEDGKKKVNFECPQHSPQHSVVVWLISNRWASLLIC